MNQVMTALKTFWLHNCVSPSIKTIKIQSVKRNFASRIRPRGINDSTNLNFLRISKTKSKTSSSIIKSSANQWAVHLPIRGICHSSRHLYSCGDNSVITAKTGHSNIQSTFLQRQPKLNVNLRKHYSSDSKGQDDPRSMVDEILKLKVQMATFREQLDSVKGKQQKRGSTDRPFVVLFEGNIGCGKSTCLDHIQAKYSDVEALVEPLDKWTNIDGHNALSLLYEDYHRWCFPFESYALLTRLQLQLQESNSRVKVLERSLYSTMHIFIENDNSKGVLHPIEYSMLKQWYDWIVKDEAAKVDLIVYLQASPETCYLRTKQRDRHEERNVSLSYPKELHKRYEDWLIKKIHPVPAPVMVIDADQDLEHVLQEVDRRSEEIFLRCI